jgi:hypothetical protein
MSTESSAPAITLGQCVRRKHDPLKALGFVLAIVFREPRELLVRWNDGTASFEREEAVVLAL